MTSSDVFPGTIQPSTSTWMGTIGSAAGWVWDGVKVTGSISNDIQSNTTRNTVCTTATVTGGILGGWSGSAIGAAVGTIICPGLGTTVGSILGTLSGGIMAGRTTIAVTDRVLDGMQYDIETRSCSTCGRGFRCKVYKEDHIKLCYGCQSLL